MWLVYARLYNAEYNKFYTVLYIDITHHSLEKYILLGKINKNISTYVKICQTVKQFLHRGAGA
jgi:hypothetical protein